MKSDAEILLELDVIVEKELAEAERRIRERVGEVIVMELSEAKRNIRKKNVGFVVYLKEIIKRFEEEDSKPVSAFTPVGKGDKKIFVELI